MSASPVTVSGRVTAEPELRFLTNGTAVLNFDIAVNHFWKNADGEQQEKVSFFKIVAWRWLAEHGANVLVKGVKVTVTGRLEQRSWENDEGKKQYAVEVIADEIGISVGDMDSFKRREREDEESNSRSSKKSSSSSSGRSSSTTKTKARQAPQDEEPF